MQTAKGGVSSHPLPSLFFFFLFFLIIVQTALLAYLRINALIFHLQSCKVRATSFLHERMHIFTQKKPSKITLQVPATDTCKPRA